MTRTILNVVLFQLAWLGTAYFAARGEGYLAALPSLAAIAAHLLLSPTRGKDFGLVILAGVAGLVAESLLLGLGFLSYAAHVPATLAPPVWIIALWAAFGTLANASLSFLQGRPALAALLGGLGGGISYYAGEQLKAITLAEPLWITYLVIMTVWALATLALTSTARRAG